MSKTNWACFDCRETVRRSGYSDGNVLCPRRGNTCRHIGHRIRVPSKRAAKAWENMRITLQAQAIAAGDMRARLRVNSIHRIEKEIARLHAMLKNEGRSKRIASLRKRLTEI